MCWGSRLTTYSRISLMKVWTLSQSSPFVPHPKSHPSFALPYLGPADHLLACTRYFSHFLPSTEHPLATSQIAISRLRPKLSQTLAESQSDTSPHFSHPPLFFLTVASKYYSALDCCVYTSSLINTSRKAINHVRDQPSRHEATATLCVEL